MDFIQTIINVTEFSSCFLYFKKTNESTIQQQRLRCSVAPSDAKDDEFSGNLSTLNNGTTVKLLQEIVPQLNRVLDEQEKLRKQLKDIRILLLILMVLLFVVPYYFFRNGSLNSLSCRA